MLSTLSNFVHTITPDRLRMSSPLLQTNKLPQFDTIYASDIEPAINIALNDVKAQFSALEQHFSNAGDKPCTYADIVESIEVIQAPLNYAWGIVSHLIAVKNSEDLRIAQEKCLPKVVKVFQLMAQSEPYYQALKQLEHERADTLDPVQKRIVRKTIRSMELSGIGLEKEKRDALNNLRIRLSELKTAFSNNVLDSRKEFVLILENKEDVFGLPETALGILSKNAVERGYSNASSEHGPWVVTLDAPSLIPFMKYANSSNLREVVYQANISVASKGPHDNQPLIIEILDIRSKICAILGYDCHTDLVFENRMAPSVKDVMDLTHFVRDKAFPLAKKELAEVEKFAHENGYKTNTDENISIKHWDVMYWAEKLKESRFEITQEELRPYFSLELVLQGLFDFMKKVLNVRVEPADGETSVWHPDVRFFNIYNNDIESTDTPIASFYLDPYSRPENKQGGAWMNVCCDKSKVLNRQPVAYLICNGSPPTGETVRFHIVSSVFCKYFSHGLFAAITHDIRGSSNTMA